MAVMVKESVFSVHVAMTTGTGRWPLAGPREMMAHDAPIPPRCGIGEMGPVREDRTVPVPVAVYRHDVPVLRAMDRVFPGEGIVGVPEGVQGGRSNDEDQGDG